MSRKIFAFIIAVGLISCKENDKFNNPITPGTTTYDASTNKAVYSPGEVVSLRLNALPADAYVRYRYLSEILKEEALTSNSWTWLPPAIDFRGYSVEVYTKENGTDKTKAFIAVDVSSDWGKFPRYGFLSEFGAVPAVKMDSVIYSMNRYHINGIQFYDWHDKHHQPLAGTAANPATGWKDIANREIQRSTVQGYIDLAHQRGMKAMFYNLCYGSLDDGPADGVQDQWYMYKDPSHKQKDAFILPKPPFKSDIFFTDPSHNSWQQYLSNKNNDLYKVYNFDGFHVDQVGNRGTVYNYNGSEINLGATFQLFLTAMKSAHPSKRLVMNAVNQFGQQGSIGLSPVDFLYTEVWDGHEGYKDLATVIQNNTKYSSGKSTVLAAYINYNKAKDPGTFNTPGVLLANAVIFAFGGSHIELGEHMLGKEYFPNNNLNMNEDLKTAIIHYYDFLTAYENLLRDGGAYNTVGVTCTNDKMNLSAWPPQGGKVAVQGKMVGSKQVLHFINLANASTFDWRDADGNQTKPLSVVSADIEVNFTGAASKVWVASPDINSGVPQTLSFTQTGNTVKFTLPELKYWDMIVIE